jgi:hypothetical protein
MKLMTMLHIQIVKRKVIKLFLQDKYNSYKTLVDTKTYTGQYLKKR